MASRLTIRLDGIKKSNFIGVCWKGLLKKVLLALVIVLMLSACGPVQTAVPTATNTAEPLATATPEPTQTPTIEPTQTLTLEPSATATLANNPTGIVGVAKNHLGTLENKGVEVEIYRVIVADAQKFDYKDWNNHDEFLDAKSIVELIVKVTNKTDGLISFLGLDYGLVAINDEQIELGQFYSKYGVRRASPEILPGISVERGLWFPVYQSGWDEIEEIRISLLGAFDARGLGLTDDFAFTISVDDWGFEAKQP